MESLFICKNHYKTKEDDTQLHIDFEFLKQQKVYFAFSYPFAYEENQKFLDKLAHDIKKAKSIYYHDDVLIRSRQGRKIHLITISGLEGITNEYQDIGGLLLFPEQNKHQPNKFNSDKKVVIVSARVHPAEAPSSHTFNGFIKFLLSKDARAFYLRKNFVFKLIPMLNPDGVAEGHYRMDLLGQNLNRFYQNPDALLQPSAYGVKELGAYYFREKKLCFYIDLHAHPQRKGNFIYGNAFESIESQVQTKLFAKILSLNSIQFEYESSSFQEKHMTLKDKNEAFSKEGCGRVVFQKEFSLPYSYTMECGYTCSGMLNQVVTIEKANRKFEKYSILNDQMDNIKSQYYLGGKKAVYFTIKAYETLGKNIAVSILDLFSLNPASRIPNTPYQTIQNIKKDISLRLQHSSLNQSNLRKFMIKPFSQQSIKTNSQQTHGSKSKTKTAVSRGGKLTVYELNLQNEKKPAFLVSKQFVFLQTKKTLSQKDTPQKDDQQSKKSRLRDQTLPKVNLFRLTHMHKGKSRIQIGNQ